MVQPDQILCGDSVELLNGLEPEWVDLCFADPPFNIGYLYHNYDDGKDVNEYKDWSRRWMSAVHRALKPTGSFYLAIGDEFAADLCVIARRELGFTLRNWIIWHYTFGQQMKRKFAKSHTHILYFTKSADPNVFTFNRDAVRVKSARETTYADKRASKGGKVPDDTWFLRPHEANYFEESFKKVPPPPESTTPLSFFDPTSDTWNVSRVCGTFKEREGWHGCQMPIAILDRIIRASSNPGDVVLDPFNGSGTTVVSAALLGRKYVGIDQSAEYVGYAKTRLDHALAHLKRNGSPSNGEAIPLDPSVMSDPTRASRVQTATDALGRPRVARRRAAKTA